MALWPAGVFSLPHKNPIHFSRARIRHGYLNWKMGVQLFLSTTLFLLSSHKIMQSEKRRALFFVIIECENPPFLALVLKRKTRQNKQNKSLIWNARQKKVRPSVWQRCHEQFTTLGTGMLKWLSQTCLVTWGPSKQRVESKKPKSKYLDLRITFHLSFIP